MQTQQTITIQRTAKPIKAQLAFSLLLIVIGLLTMFVTDHSLLGMLMFVIGLLLNLTARIKRWWHHS